MCQYFLKSYSFNYEQYRVYLGRGKGTGIKFKVPESAIFAEQLSDFNSARVEPTQRESFFSLVFQDNIPYRVAKSSKFIFTDILKTMLVHSDICLSLTATQIFQIYYSRK